MLALEVWVNGRRVALAGSEDLCVLNAIVNAVGQLGEKSHGTKRRKKDFDLFLSVGGLTSRPPGKKDEHLTWLSGRPLKVGDDIRVKLVETMRAQRHQKSSPAEGNTAQMNERRLYKWAKKEYERLRSKYELPER